MCPRVGTISVLSLSVLDVDNLSGQVLSLRKLMETVFALGGPALPIPEQNLRKEKTRTPPGAEGRLGCVMKLV